MLIMRRARRLQDLVVLVISFAFAEICVAASGPVVVTQTSTGVAVLRSQNPLKPKPARQKLRAKPLSLDFVSEVEFLDDNGIVKKRIVPGEKGISHIRILAGGKFVGINQDGQTFDEAPKNAGGGAISTRGMIFHFLNADGKELWSADICCPRDTRVGTVSEDGKVVVIADVGAGESCAEYDPAGGGPTCWGLRVLSWDGKILYRDRKGPLHGEAYISPRGHYLIAEYVLVKRGRVYKTGWIRINVRSGEKLSIPQGPDGRWPLRPRDDGSVVFPGSPDEGIAPLVWTPAAGFHEEGTPR